MNLKLEKKDKKKIKVPFLSGYALKTGVHIGHKSLRLSKTNFWHPLMAHYFLGIRHGISLVDPIQTRKCLLRAFYVIALVLKAKHVSTSSGSGFLKRSIFSKTKVLEKEIRSKKEVNFNSFLSNKKEKKQIKQSDISLKPNFKEPKTSGHILIINTNPEFSRLCKNLSVLTLHTKNTNILVNKNTRSFFLNEKKNPLSYVHYKWVGGTLTNWKQVSKSVLTYAKFAERCEKFIYHSTIDFPRYKKIKECFHGLITKKQGKVYLAFNEKPDLVFIMNPNENQHIIAEANKMHIPVIALVESNTCLKGISYPIPANAYSAFFIYYCLKKIIKLSTI